MKRNNFRLFLAELRERKVFRATALYLVIAFGLLEAADILQESIGFPGRFIPWFTASLLAGIPVAVTLAWMIDVTPTGITRFRSPRGVPRAPSSWPIAGLAVTSVIALAAASWVVGVARPGERSAPPLRASIAVLPFTNLSGDSENDYFGDGLAEELTSTLSRIRGLHVTARTSAFALRDLQLSAMEIGDTLGVAAFLEGSVRRAGSQVRIGARLVRSEDGRSLWSNTWERELDVANIFGIQDEITMAIAAELQRELLPESSSDVSLRPADLEAYDLYLLGRHQWAKRTPGGLASAISFFEQALEVDPTYAPAWAGLANAWEARPFFDRAVTVVQADSAARPAALQAMELAPDLAEAQAALGVIISDYDYDYATAIDLLVRAVELNPNYSQAWAWLCVARSLDGDPSEGLADCDRAVELDPLSPTPQAQRALALMALERFEEALVALRAADDLGPVAWTLAVALQLKLDQADDIEADLIRLGTAGGLEDPDRMRLVAGSIRGDPGREEALAVVRDLESAQRIGFLELAPLYSWIGAEEEALRVFNRAVEERDPWLPFARLVTSFEAIRAHQDLPRP